MSLLAIMGSGETAPTMVKVHRRIFDTIGDGPALLLDTPYGFQGNADDLNERAVAYFADIAGRVVTPLRWRRPDDRAAADRAAAALRDARWAFAGPGSPTYALRVWRGSGIDTELADVVRRGGASVFASAAALTLGSHTVPVYEVYKVGDEPVWHPGLGVLEAVTGLRAAVVPHWDNSEGGNHDTRFCYLGERRLRILEDDLPDEVGILGVDEHTALLIDPRSGTADVTGRGSVTARYRGTETTWESGATIAIGDLAQHLAGRGGSPFSEVPRTTLPTAVSSAGHPEAPGVAAGSLREASDAAESAFAASVAAGDAPAAAAAVLDLEQAIVDWSADTTQSDEYTYARRTLRSLVVRLGDLASEGVLDPAQRVAPFVRLLLDRRDAARDARDWPAADAVRDGLASVGVEVRDTPDGVEWHLRSE